MRSNVFISTLLTLYLTTGISTSMLSEQPSYSDIYLTSRKMTPGILLASDITDSDEEANIGDPDEEANIGDPDEEANVGDPDEEANVGDPDAEANVGDPDEEANVGDPKLNLLRSEGFYLQSQAFLRWMVHEYQHPEFQLFCLPGRVHWPH